MCGVGNDICVLVCTALLGAAEPGGLPTTSVLFSPVRLVAVIIWVYLCMYCVEHIHSHPLVGEKYKPAANVLSLVFGPLILFMLFIVDTTKKLEEGEKGVGDIFKDLFGSAFESRKKSRDGKERPIELLDSSGRSFSEVYGDEDDEKKASNEILDMTEKIVLDAISERASDVLIDPKSNDIYSLRFRVDGFLRTIDEIEGDTAVAIINSIKVISGMDIAERRRPQDGAFLGKIPRCNVFFRVASAGVLGGEKLSIRVLNQSTGLLRLDEIGLSEDSYIAVSDIIKQSAGMIIVCGPTGSGKTTSLYAMLSNIDFYERNVVTVEDPIEYVLPNASQIEVNVKADITFANALRSVLRQDPDVICVGEIRDSETADMALQASQTGHLVLATLHSSSNMAALVRLMDLGIKPLLLASALSIIVSQRLVRRLCENCKCPAELNDEQIARFKKKGINPEGIMTATGCDECYGTGYRGRMGILDVMRLDRDVKAKLADDKLSLGDLKKEGDEKGRSTLKQEGMRQVLAGITTLEEVKRVISSLG
ncbi:MAG: GspE/PulE family protein [Planctomycetota bacterium]|jgi:type II secretory ATPase GspE/PulE/Tfp pilus assembly ATPase PilB-like protein